MRKFFTLLPAILLSVGLFAQTQRTVLFEEFTGENCGPCAQTNPGLDAIFENSNQGIIIKYMSPIPSAGWFYNQNAADANTRINYYGVNYAPWGEQDGAIWDSSLISGGSPNHPGYYTANYMNTEYGVSSPFALTVTHVFTTTDSFYATINITAAQAFTATGINNLKLRLALVEVVNFSSPPGSNGESYFPNAVRKMYPNPTGTALTSSWTNAQTQTLTIGGKLPAYLYDKTKCTFVAWIQDDGTGKHIMQAAQSAPYAFPVDAKAQSIDGQPVVCVSTVQPTIRFANIGSQHLTSCTLKVIVDQAVADTIPWTGDIAPGDSITTTVPSPISLTSGSHLIKVVLTNPNGVPDPNKGTDTVGFGLTVEDSPGIAPLIEGFESGLPSTWGVYSPQGTTGTWTLATAGHNSTKSYKMNFYNIAAGTEADLFVQAVSTLGASNASISFDHAYKQYSSAYNDSLYVEASTDCGRSWTTFYAKGGSSLATAAVSTTSYSAPVAADWKNDSLDISAVANHRSVIIRFRAVSAYGNNLFLDNINIDTSGFAVAPTAVETISGLTSVSLYPNPTSQQLNVVVDLSKQATVSYTVTNAIGEIMLASKGEERVAGVNTLNLNTASMANGIYFLTITAGTQRETKLFTVIH